MTVKIHGKDYMEVKDRLQIFRTQYPNHCLVTEIHNLTEDRVVMKASVIKVDGEFQVVVATGFAFEDKGSTTINKTSFIENCETSAWGRALANFGIGLDTAVSSAEEVLGGEGAELSRFEKWAIMATEICEAAQSLEDIIKWWPDNSDAIKKELKPTESAKIYEMVVARKRELKTADREPGAEG